MSVQIILASGSEIRATLLRNAGVTFDVQQPRVDEGAIKTSLTAENAKPRDIADALAEHKARKISERNPSAMVVGCDQILTLEGALISKPATPQEAVDQIKAMRAKAHHLISAAVICENGQPVWRHTGVVKMQMRDVSDSYVSGYVARNWASIRNAVGAYKLEEEGARLFERIDGDYFHVLGLPLLEVLGYLDTRGVLVS